MTISTGNIILADDVLGCERTTIEAGEAIAIDEWCYINKADGKAYISTTAVQDKRRVDGVAITAAVLGADTILIRSGKYVNAAAYVDKTTYYLGAAGALQVGISAIEVGVADGTDDLYIHIRQDDRAKVGTIKAWHQDSASMPAGMISAFWLPCDGAVINDAESPLNGDNLANLNAGQLKFLRGNNASGATAVPTHTHTLIPWVAPALPVSNAGAAYGDTTGTSTSVPTYFEVVWLEKIK